MESDAEQLQTLGQEFLNALVGAYATNAAAGSIVFLPMGVAVPDLASLTNDGVFNPLLLQNWFTSSNFDYPCVTSTANSALLTVDQSNQTLSQIYYLALSQAQPVGNPDDPGWQLIAAEIASARQTLGSAEIQMTIDFQPSDWFQPSATGYWMTFNSSQTSSSTSSTSTATTPTATPGPVASPPFWQLRARIEPIEGVSHELPLVREVPRTTYQPELIGAGASLEPTRSNFAPANELLLRPQLDINVISANTTTVSTASTASTATTTSSSTITISLQHQCVSLGRYTAGQSSWNGGLLANPVWCVAGVPAGGILPAPANSGADAAYGLPVAMIVVQGLTVSGQWSSDALAALSTPGASVGPLALFGAAATTHADGVTISFSQSGMQVVALICTPLPLIPPASAANAPSSSAASGATAATSGATASTSSSAPATNGNSDGASLSSAGTASSTSAPAAAGAPNAPASSAASSPPEQAADTSSGSPAASGSVSDSTAAATPAPASTTTIPASTSTSSTVPA